MTADRICATVFARVVWFPDCLPWFNYVHTWEWAARCRVFGFSVSMELNQWSGCLLSSHVRCEMLFGFNISLALRPKGDSCFTPLAPHPHLPAWICWPPDTLTLWIWPYELNQEPALLICHLIPFILVQTHQDPCRIAQPTPVPSLFLI